MRTLLSRLLAEKPSERPANAKAALKLLDRHVPVGVLSVGGSAALALVAFLVMGPGLTKKASVDEAALKDVEAPVQQQKEPPVAQAAQAPEPKALELSEPQKLPEPALTKKSTALEAPTRLPAKNSPWIQSKTLPAKLINPTNSPPKGTPKKQRGKASGTGSGKM